MRPFLLAGFLLTASAAPAITAPPRAVDLGAARVKLHPPVLVAESRGYLWYPVLHRLSDGSLLAVANNYPDLVHSQPTGQLSWSTDGGATWSRRKPGTFGGVGVPLPDGDLLLVPHWLRARKGEEFGAAVRVPRGKQETLPDGEYVVGAFPRPFPVYKSALGPHEPVGSFHPTGRVLPVKDGLLGMMTGRWDGPGEELRLIAIHSTDGKNWRYRSTIAGREWKQSQGGPNEGALTRLKDGRLLCMFRHSVPVPFGMCTSSDEGKTWTEPTLMPAHVRSVKPSALTLPDGTVVLSGGRPGVFVWLNPDGSGSTWLESIDVVAHHNAFVSPTDPMRSSTGYTDIVALDARTVLVIYDTRARNWDPHLGHIVPEDSPEFNRVWIMKIEIEKR